MSPRLDPFDLGPPSLPWRLTLALSIGLHLIGFFLVFGLPRLLPRPAFTPVYVVDLVSLPGGPAVGTPPAAAPESRPAAPAPAAAPKKEDKAITLPERGAKKAQPKKTPETKKTPEARPTPAKSVETKNPATPRGTPAPSEPAASATSTAGSPGGTGAPGGGFGGSGEAQTDALNFYSALVKKNIENAWKKPLYPASETSRKTFTTQVRVIVTSSGRVNSVVIVAPSGYEAMDQSVTDAVHDAIFPPFPSSLGYPVLALPIEMVLTPD